MQCTFAQVAMTCNSHVDVFSQWCPEPRLRFTELHTGCVGHQERGWAEHQPPAHCRPRPAAGRSAPGGGRDAGGGGADHLGLSAVRAPGEGRVCVCVCVFVCVYV